MSGSIVVTEYMAIDGVIQDPGGSGEYDRGGWSFEYDRGEEGDTFKLGELMAADAQLYGRITYEGMAAAWPTMEDEAGFADRMISMPKYVVSTTLEDPDWENTRVISENVVEGVAKLKDQYDRDIRLEEVFQRLPPGRCLEQVFTQLVQDDFVAQKFRLLVVNQKNIDLCLLHHFARAGQRCSHMRMAISNCSVLTGLAR